MKRTDTHGLDRLSSDLAAKLMSKGLLSKESLDKATDLCKGSGASLAETIARLKLLPKTVVYEELAGIYGVPFVDLDSYSSDPTVVSLVDEKTARDLKVFPLFAIGQSLSVALAQPDDIMAIDRLTAVSKYTIEPFLACPEDVIEAINRTYGSGSEIKEFLEKMSEDSVPVSKRAEATQKTVQSSDSPVSRLVDLIVTNAIRDRASDIHIFLDDTNMKVRFRIDGVLYDVPPPPNYLFPFIVSRIKVMSNMDIAESQIPLDGHFKSTIEGQTVEARVSSVPTVHGESIAIRLLNTAAMAISLENLGVSESLLGRLDEMIHHNHGMVVVTGPTGSGKSTTLYAMLSKVNSSERHIVTIEDPVERRMAMVSQIQTNEKAGLTFASALRSILRQDPDVIMVGEIRDHETAQLAVRAALTGHLVFSTIHTNDAPGVATRLINMSIEPFLLASSLVGAISQRLARRICEDCKQPHDIPAALRKRLKASGITLPARAWRGAGCPHCRNTGYSRRIGVFELMAVTPAAAELIATNAPTVQLHAQACRDGMVSMLDDGLAKVEQGITTIEEVLRIAELEGVVDTEAAPSRKPEPGKPAEEEEAVPAGRIGLDLDDYKRKMANWLATTQR